MGTGGWGLEGGEGQIVCTEAMWQNRRVFVHPSNFSPSGYLTVATKSLA